MYSSPLGLRGICATLLVLVWHVSVLAQEPAPNPSQPGSSDASVVDHQHVVAAPGMDHPTAREWGGSGTSWLPDSAPMYMLYAQAGQWQWMAHGNLFVQYLEDAGARGQAQVGSINWLMAMGRRRVGAGRVTVRAMGSAEPWTIRGCGYPNLLANGEVCGRKAIVDQQHPHDAFMELTIGYDRPLVRSVRWFAYAGPAGEPALGPVAFPHRPAAVANPLSPISHHWHDATHITFGVVTAGVFSARWKVESSVFNGREPDDARRNFDFGRLDSYSGRVTFVPGPNVALQVSAGHLEEAEAAHGAEPSHDVDRVTASVLLQGTAGGAGWWAATIAWARNHEVGGGTQALLGEVSVTLRERHALFGRAELNGKEAHDLSLHGPRQVFGVGKLQSGYTRYLRPVAGFQPGIGASVSASLVPEPLRTVFGSRVNGGFGVFLTLRPARHQM